MTSLYQASRSAREERPNVWISPTHRTADPATETLCAGAHAQRRPGRRSRARHVESRAYQRTIVATRRRSQAWLPTIMHHQNVNQIRGTAREGAPVDEEGCS